MYKNQETMFELSLHHPFLWCQWPWPLIYNLELTFAEQVTAYWWGATGLKSMWVTAPCSLRMIGSCEWNSNETINSWLIDVKALWWQWTNGAQPQPMQKTNARNSATDRNWNKTSHEQIYVHWNWLNSVHELWILNHTDLWLGTNDRSTHATIKSKDKE